MQKSAASTGCGRAVAAALDGGALVPRTFYLRLLQAALIEYDEIRKGPGLSSTESGIGAPFHSTSAHDPRTKSNTPRQDLDNLDRAKLLHIILIGQRTRASSPEESPEGGGDRRYGSALRRIGGSWEEDTETLLLSQLRRAGAVQTSCTSRERPSMLSVPIREKRLWPESPGNAL